MACMCMYGLYVLVYVSEALTEGRAGSAAHERQAVISTAAGQPVERF
jgi:hypothetical protein